MVPIFSGFPVTLQWITTLFLCVFITFELYIFMAQTNNNVYVNQRQTECHIKTSVPLDQNLELYFYQKLIHVLIYDILHH